MNGSCCEMYFGGGEDVFDGNGNFGVNVIIFD